MRTVPRIVMCVVALLLVASAFSQDVSLNNRRIMLDAAVAKAEYTRAYVIALDILKAAAGRDPASLTVDDAYAIGLAHYYLAAESLGRALQIGGLPDTAAMRARHIVADVAPTPTAGGVQVVGHGDEVKLEDYLVAGKTTIVDFFSEYCGPCRALSPRLEALARQRQDIAVVKVDINRPGTVGIDWGSPVARQYKLSGIPYLRVYGPDKQLQLEGAPAMQQVLGWCQAP